ncbi:uncharacterized protein LOC111603080 [Drosophila hydei]|uniref:Uncharacterized protein LOC111603080 n=1 Tax=Drosophila hydei TaxID=7224 RepID=A0A6J2SX55_DROHY|nr:uncharacterized protein LOC111603080 [Drosophila hydei]
MSFRFLKRERGGWHPFLYAMTVDICHFFDGTFKNPLTTIIYNYMKAYTNFNHSCPYLANTDIRLIRFNLNELDILSRFPVDDGVYGLHTSWYIKNTLVCQMNSSASLTKSYRRP